MAVIKNVFDSKVASDVLCFLSDNVDNEYLSGEITKKSGHSRMGVYLALSRLKDKGYVNSVKKSNLNFYSVNYKDPAVKQFKIFRNTAALGSLAKKLAPVSDKVILFGSVSRGEDTQKSDIDIVVIADEDEHEEIKKLIASQKLTGKIAPVLMTPYAFNKLKKKAPTFYNEVSAGIILWEREQ